MPINTDTLRTATIDNTPTRVRKKLYEKREAADEACEENVIIKAIGSLAYVISRRKLSNFST